MVNQELVHDNHDDGAITTRLLVQKKKDLGALTIPCTIRVFNFAKALWDVGANKKWMLPPVYKKLDLEAPTPTIKQLLMADQMIKKHIGILYDVIIYVEYFIFLANFVILDCEVDFNVPIMGRPFLTNGWALVDMELDQHKFRLNDKEVIFNIFQSMKQLDDWRVVSVIESINEVQLAFPIEEKLDVETLVEVLMNFKSDGIANYDDMVNALWAQGYYRYLLKLELDLKNHKTPPTRPSIEALDVSLKALLSHLWYVFLGHNNTLPVIIVADLDDG